MTLRTATLAGIAIALIATSCGGGGRGDAPVETPTQEPTPTRFAAGVIIEGGEDPDLPGVHVDLQGIYDGFYGNSDGNTTAPHVTQDVDYEADGNSNPPAGGPHWAGGCGNVPSEAPQFCGPAPWGIYREPWQPETLIHNMEHAGAVVWYNTTDQAVIDDLEDLVNDLRGPVVLTPYFDMEDEHVAVTTWARIDKFPVSEYSRERVEEFLDVHNCRFNPENLPDC
ncbi:MAG: DUF3105 domain-containing protein [Chloroflexi bacterium]|nr:DUF3105 domain-containing protein [Chloroflexota bacterium]MCH8065452.1 DUF3105 domain-containing protein [Chloroflexota bacterium]